MPVIGLWLHGRRLRPWRTVLGVVRRGIQFRASGVRGDGRKSKGAKQVPVGVLHEQGHLGNHVMLKRQHVTGEFRPPRSPADAAPLGCTTGRPRSIRARPTAGAPGAGRAATAGWGRQKLVVRPRGTYSAPPD